jgi:hypothetical protein
VSSNFLSRDSSTASLAQIESLKFCKAHGREAMNSILSRLAAFGIPVAAADADRAVRAALIRFETTIAYVDALGVELTSDTRDHVFVTADFDFKLASRHVKIEFLPAT